MPNTAARQLGRRAPKNAPALRLSEILTGVIPEHPVAADNLSKATYGLYDNDTFGVCGPTSAANMRRQVTKYLTGTEFDPSQNDVFDLYKRSGNPNFDPADPGGPGDQGVDMQTMLEAVHSGGIGGVKCLAFAKVDVRNEEEIRAALAIFGSLLLGVNLDVAQQDQQGTWDFVKGSPTWGGHAVLSGGYTAQDMESISWAEKFRMTLPFWENQVEEAWVVIWEEHLGSTAFQQGVDKQALEQAYTQLTGRTFPEPQPAPEPQPTPEPAPAPVDSADQLLFAAVGRWMTEHHYGQTHMVAQALKTWSTSKGLKVEGP